MIKRIMLGAILIAAIPLSFKLFEPVFVYTSGWADLPDAFPATASDVDPGEWSVAATGAQNALVAGRQGLEAPAISAAVSIDGQMVWRGVTGFSDLEAATSATFDTRFRIGSTSKAVTAVAVGTLIDDGRLDVDTAIQTYVPSYSRQGTSMTLGQVMSHRAGIRDYGLCLCFPIWEHQNRRAFESIDAAVALVAASPLAFDPGAGFQYTSLGYNLVGAAIEGASDQTYERYLAEAVFAPLDMDHSGLDHKTRQLGRAVFYETNEGRFKPAFAVDNSIRWASGGIVSTPTDMVSLGNAMLDDRLLTAATRGLLVTVPHGGGSSAGAKMYALGWRHSAWQVHNGRLATDAFHHAGTAVGSMSVLVVLPEYRLVISVMMNKGGDSADGLFAVTDRIIEAFIAPRVPQKGLDA